MGTAKTRHELRMPSEGFMQLEPDMLTLFYERYQKVRKHVGRDNSQR